MPVMSTENQRNEAFERFFAHRNNKTVIGAFREVSTEMNIPESTIRSWCYKYNWSEMVERKQETMLSNVQAQVEEIITTEVKMFCDGIMVLIREFIERVKKKEIQVNTIKEFNDLVSSYSKLQGLVGKNFPNDNKESRGVSIVVVNGILRPTGEQPSNQHIIDIRPDSETEPST